jgi:ribosomal protein S21
MALDVYLRDGESQESLLKRFQRSVQMSGLLKEAKAKRYFVSKGDAARMKSKAAARKRRRQSSPSSQDKF